MEVKIVSGKIISNYFLRCFGIDRAILCKKFSEAFLSLFIHGQNNHSALSAARIALQSEKIQGFAFVPMGGNPVHVHPVTLLCNLIVLSIDLFNHAFVIMPDYLFAVWLI